AEVLLDLSGVVIGPALIDVHRHELEARRRAPRQNPQRVEKDIRVLPARDANHDAISVGDEVEVTDRLADPAHDGALELGGKTEGTLLARGKKRSPRYRRS